MILTKTNSKLEKTSKLNKVKIWNFNLPAYKTKSGKTVCPFAKDCIKFCYAQKGRYLFSNVKNKYETNYKLSKQDNFPGLIQQEIDKIKPTHLRIHSSGDFYSFDYLLKWVTLAIVNPEVIFYGYTKSVPLFKKIDKFPENFRFCFSLGGKKDNLINIEKDYHSRIFTNQSDLLNAGYIDASQDDLNSIGNNNKIGLIYH